MHQPPRKPEPPVTSTVCSCAITSLSSRLDAALYCVEAGAQARPGRDGSYGVTVIFPSMLAWITHSKLYVPGFVNVSLTLDGNGPPSARTPEPSKPLPWLLPVNGGSGGGSLG